MRGSPAGRSGIGLLAFAVLAIVVVIFVAAVAFEVGHQLAIAQRALGLIP
jgi:hypothetical protein